MSSHVSEYGLTSREFRRLRSLRDPWGIQRFLDNLPYHLASTAWSPRRVLRENTAHCFEGAIFGAAALRVIGYKSLILDFEAVRDTDHVLAIFKERGHWGAIAKSNFSGLRFREPVYKTIRELALSYFDSYFNLRGERTLRRFSRPVNLARFDARNWMTTEKPIWFIADHLTKIRHYPLVEKRLVAQLRRIDSRSLRAGLVGHAKKLA